MSNEDGKLIMQLARKKISDQEFLDKYSGDPREEGHVQALLERALQERNADLVEDAVILGFHFGFHAGCARILSQLLLEPWHVKHEDIARALQRLRDPVSVQALYRAALADFDYLSFDENYSLGVKCAWALGKIGTPEALAKLKELAKTDREPVREAALEQLRKANADAD